jgi:asparagine synthase (glutamine-hydrolysing)
MCGIVGMLRLDGGPADRRVLQRMRDAMWHRGPDDAGIWCDGPLGLGHRRLSILDLSPLGHQPMHAPDGSASIVFNGEIFNFVELREALEARGERFVSGSDTEVLLRLWLHHGMACVDELVGMFGFAIWDRDRRRLFAARDRLGIKPFYYARTATHWLFASEIKALLAHPEVSPRLDARSMADVIYSGYPLEDRTMFDGIRVLLPGHCLTFEDGHLEVRPYWTVRYDYDTTRTLDETVEALRPLLDDAVRLHCRSDAPIGAHLSGGLDSSTVATLAAGHRAGLPTFSIRFDEGGAFDESRYAREVAARIRSVHHEESPGDLSLDQLLPLLPHHVETPVTRTAIAYFGAARLARRHVTVALTGHGGDEVFGGYPAQFEVGLGVPGDEASAVTANARPVSSRERFGFLWRSEGLGGLLERARRRVTRRAPGDDSASDRWIERHCGLPEPGQHPALTSSMKRAFEGYSPRTAFLEAFERAPTDEPFDRCLHHDLRSYLPSLLHVEDRTSMALSLESRVPLLDHRLVEFAATVPPAIKVAGHRSKQLIRRAMRGRLPDALIDRRDKGAFPVPIERWMDGPAGDAVCRLLLEKQTLDRGIYSQAWIRASVAHRRSLIPLLALELWCRMYLDGDSELHARAMATSEAVRLDLGIATAGR